MVEESPQTPVLQQQEEEEEESPGDHQPYSWSGVTVPEPPRHMPLTVRKPALEVSLSSDRVKLARPPPAARGYLCRQNQRRGNSIGVFALAMLRCHSVLFPISFAH